VAFTWGDGHAAGFAGPFIEASRVTVTAVTVTLPAQSCRSPFMGEYRCDVHRGDGHAGGFAWAFIEASRVTVTVVTVTLPAQSCTGPFMGEYRRDGYTG
jgi:hypothetical protein